MRIVVVQETDWLARGPHQQHHLFDRLSARGHQVTVLDFEILWKHWPRSPLWVRRREWPAVSRVLPSARVRVIRPATVRLLPLCRPSSVVTHYLELSQLVRAQRPDVIVDYALSTGLPALAVARRAGVPFVFHVIDALHTIVPQRLLQPIAQGVERRLMRAADQVVVINDGLRDYAVAMGARPERAVTLRTGVDLERIRPEADGAALRAQWGLAPEDVALFFMGWLYRFAGLSEWIDLLAAAPPNYKLLIIGDGDAHPDLMRQVESRGLSGRVIFAGRQPYELVPQFLAAADICLLPSQVNAVTRHIVPVKMYEYMAGGRPVIASRLPGVMRDVPEGNGVFYADPADQLDLALSLADPARRREAGARARAFVEQHCDWEQLTHEFEGLLRRAARRN